MQLLMVLTVCCVTTLSTARPQKQGKGPYNYNIQKSLDTGLKSSQLADLLPQSLLQNFQQPQSRILNSAPFMQQSFKSDKTSQLQHGYQQQHEHNQQNEQIHLQFPIPNDSAEEKKIVLHLPPQQYSVQPQLPYQLPPRKHYKIVLVRSPPLPAPIPEPPLPEVEEQTLIYVLVKKPDESTEADLQKIQHAQKEAIKLNRPEVYFIKYKTNNTQQQSFQESAAASTSKVDNNNNDNAGYNYEDASRVSRGLIHETDIKHGLAIVPKDKVDTALI